MLVATITNWIAVGWWLFFIAAVAAIAWATRGDRQYRRKGRDDA